MGKTQLRAHGWRMFAKRRWILALVIGIAVAGLGYLLFATIEHSLPLDLRRWLNRNEVLAFGGIGALSFILAVAALPATSSAPTAALTPFQISPFAREMGRIECVPTHFWWFRIVAGAIFTFGIGGIIWWLTYVNLPRFIDREGIVLRSGKILRWNELRGVVHEKTMNSIRRDVQTDYSLELRFSSGAVSINPFLFVNGVEVVASVEKLLNVSARPHMLKIHQDQLR